MIRPDVAEFDRTEIPSLKLLRCLPAELHGVIVKLHDALKEMRSCVFRIGQDVMQDAEIALVAGMPSDVLVSTLPAIIRKGMMARDDAGALFSPHFYDKVLRSEERAARKAQAEQDHAEWLREAKVNGEDMPAGRTLKQWTSMQNGKKGGRPRGTGKNRASVAGQKNMPFYGVVGGTGNPSKKPESAQVIENDNPPGFSGSLEEERDNNTLNNNNSSSSLSRKPENPKPDEAEVERIARKARDRAGLGPDQRTFSITYTRNWLTDGIEEETILRVSALKKGEARQFNYLDIPVRDAHAQKMAEKALAAEEALAEEACPEWQKTARKMLDKAKRVFAEEIKKGENYSSITHRWPEICMERGLPPIERTLEAYEAHFNPEKQKKAA
ncbi:hypothetical protein NKW84_10125 [Acetobacter senegalensis]|uniref:hypothetical protein n=1 Tax=Acetobacter senegalensis TaxID=446692 RepID=UPI00209D7E9A|nr:hypothetical protein [Acetobacter senegalensis]MCP1196214.1 hypothetical protein [Acetobacter senegalensis]